MVLLVRVLAASVVALLALQSAVSAHSAAAVRAALEATLVVYTDAPEPAFLGSAFVVATPAGPVVVTNAHVLDGRQRVVLKDRGGRFWHGEVIKVDAKRDLAAVRVPGVRVALQAGDVPEIADGVFAIGAPLGHEFTVTSGIISATKVRLHPAVPVSMIRHDAAINPGSSGGPLVDGSGRVLGMNSEIADGSRLFAGIAYAIPIDVVLAWLRGELSEVPELGFVGRPVTAQIAQALGLAQGRGVLVDAVEPLGWAEMAGIAAGDVILAVNGVSIETDGGLMDAVVQRHSSRVGLSVWRDGVRMDMMAVLPPQDLVLAQTDEAAPLGNLAQAGIRFADGAPIVAEVDMSKPHVGLFEGDRILSWNGAPLNPAKSNDLATRPLDGPVLLLVARDERTLHILLDPAGAASQKIFGGNVLDPAVVSY